MYFCFAQWLYEGKMLMNPLLLFNNFIFNLFLTKIETLETYFGWINAIKLDGDFYDKFSNLKSFAISVYCSGVMSRIQCIVYSYQNATTTSITQIKEMSIKTHINR